MRPVAVLRDGAAVFGNTVPRSQPDAPDKSSSVAGPRDRLPQTAHASSRGRFRERSRPKSPCGARRLLCAGTHRNPNPRADLRAPGPPPPPPATNHNSIGETGFEPATARPPAGCATRLRHSPWPGPILGPGGSRRLGPSAPGPAEVRPKQPRACFAVGDDLLLRRCGRCNRRKPLDQFAWRRKARDQRDSYCRPCRADRPWPAILAEIDKCEVVCANCHRRRTTREGGFARAAVAQR